MLKLFEIEAIAAKGDRFDTKYENHSFMVMAYSHKAAIRRVEDVLNSWPSTRFHDVKCAVQVEKADTRMLYTDAH